MEHADLARALQAEGFLGPEDFASLGSTPGLMASAVAARLLAAASEAGHLSPQAAPAVGEALSAVTREAPAAELLAWVRTHGLPAASPRQAADLWRAARDVAGATQAAPITQAGPGTRVPARAGAAFGPYDLQDELGRGGMGAVFRARERATGRVVAVKVVKGEVEADGLERFRREGQIASSLDHPGIVRVHAAGVVEGTPYLTYELVEGARHLLAAAAALPPLERARLLRDAARALGHAHARGVVHRDVKPENILVDAAGRVRVTDFGVAAARGLERLTATGALVGTPAYMAPEQLDGDRVRLGPWSDVWALGVVLHEVLTGQRPFDSPVLPRLFRQILTGVPRPVHELAPGTPPALSGVCARALAKEPSARYAHGDALADDLERVLAEAARPTPGE